MADFVSEACDVDNIRPVVRLHQHPCSMGTGNMEGSWTASIRALYAGTRHFLNSLSAEDTFLHGQNRTECELHKYNSTDFHKHLQDYIAPFVLLSAFYTLQSIFQKYNSELQINPAIHCYFIASIFAFLGNVKS